MRGPNMNYTSFFASSQHLFRPNLDAMEHTIDTNLNTTSQVLEFSLQDVSTLARHCVCHNYVNRAKFLEDLFKHIFHTLPVRHVGFGIYRMYPLLATLCRNLLSLLILA